MGRRVTGVAVAVVGLGVAGVAYGGGFGGNPLHIIMDAVFRVEDSTAAIEQETAGIAGQTSQLLVHATELQDTTTFEVVDRLDYLISAVEDPPPVAPSLGSAAHRVWVTPALFGQTFPVIDVFNPRMAATDVGITFFSRTGTLLLSESRAFTVNGGSIGSVLAPADGWAIVSADTPVVPYGTNGVSDVRMAFVPVDCDAHADDFSFVCSFVPNDDPIEGPGGGSEPVGP